MRVHYALGRPGCARRVDERDQVARAYLSGRRIEPARRLRSRGGAALEELIPANCPRSLAFDQHDVAQRRQTMADSIELLEHARVLDKGDLRVAMGDDVCELLRREGVVQAHRDGAGVQ